jgi:hypothetical protein
LVLALRKHKHQAFKEGFKLKSSVNFVN